jgi:hypothetical protein
MAKRIRKARDTEDTMMMFLETKGDQDMKVEMDAIQSDLEALYRSKGAKIKHIKTKVGKRTATGFFATTRDKPKRKPKSKRKS